MGGVFDVYVTHDKWIHYYFYLKNYISITKMLYAEPGNRWYEYIIDAHQKEVMERLIFTTNKRTGTIIICIKRHGCLQEEMSGVTARMMNKTSTRNFKFPEKASWERYSCACNNQQSFHTVHVPLEKLFHHSALLAKVFYSLFSFLKVWQYE